MKRRTSAIHRFIALRHLTSSHRRGFLSFITVIAIVGVLLGVASLIITLSILNGFERTIHENIISFTAHLQITGFQDQFLSDPERSMQTVYERHSEVTAITPFVSREGMVRAGEVVEGILIKGVDPSSDISAAKTRLVEGTYDLEERTTGMQTAIIGMRLAEKLRVGIGDEILLYALGGRMLSLSETRVFRVQVAGIFETGMAEFDGSMVYVNLRNAQRLFQVGTTVSGYDVLVSDMGALSRLAQEIPEDLGYPHYARTMYQQYRNLFTWIELQKKPIPILLGLIIIVATVNIVGTLLMMVMEKAREIGALRTMGMTRKAIVRMFLWKGGLIGLVGTVLGNMIAYGICWLELTYRFFPLPSGVYFMTHVPIDMALVDFIAVSLMALLMSVVASIFPARVAASIDPIRILRFS